MKEGIEKRKESQKEQSEETKRDIALYQNCVYKKHKLILILKTPELSAEKEKRSIYEKTYCKRFVIIFFKSLVWCNIFEIYEVFHNMYFL